MKPLAQFIGAALVGALVLLTAPAAQAQVGISINIGTPAWGPQVPYGTQYYYIPEIDGYYDLYNQQYIVYQDGYWMPLPELYGYDPYRFHPVVVQYRGREPWRQSSYYHQRYAHQPYRSYGRGGYRHGYYGNGYGGNGYGGGYGYPGGYYGGRGYHDHDHDDRNRGYGGGRDHENHDERGNYGSGDYNNGPRGGQPQYPGGDNGGPRNGGHGGQPQPQSPQPGGADGQVHGGPGNGSGQGQGTSGQGQGGGRTRRD